MRTWVTRGVIVLFVLVLAAAAWFYGPVIGGMFANPNAQEPSATSMITGGALPPGCTCHSKDTKMVSMHARFGISDCGKCHGNVGEIFKAKTTTEVTSQKICKECHK